MFYPKLVILLFTTRGHWTKLNTVQATTAEEMIYIDLCVRDSICIDEAIPNSTVKCYSKSIFSNNNLLLVNGTTNSEGCVYLQFEDVLNLSEGVNCEISHSNSTHTKLTKRKYMTTSNDNGTRKFDFDIVEMEFKKSSQECLSFNDNTLQLRVQSTCNPKLSSLPNAYVTCYQKRSFMYDKFLASGSTDSEGFVSLQYDGGNDTGKIVYCIITHNNIETTQTEEKSTIQSSNKDSGIAVDFGTIKTKCSTSRNDDTPVWLYYTLSFILIGIGIVFFIFNCRCFCNRRIKQNNHQCSNGSGDCGTCDGNDGCDGCGGCDSGGCDGGC